MFDAEELWPGLLEQAETYRQRNTKYYSVPKVKPYSISSTENGVIRIIREGGGEDATLSIVKFRTCILNIINNRQQYFIPNAGIYKNVATETTIVELLPMLDWEDNNGNMLILPEINSRDNVQITAISFNGQDGWYWADRRIRARRGQIKLRIKLLEVFEGCCAITNCKIHELLDACHIEPFSESENCFVENALLLRSDIHDLFDANFLAIDPLSREIRIDRSITDPTYLSLDGNTLRNPNNVELNMVGLHQRWQAFQAKQG